MNQTEFCYHLQGFCELTGNAVPTAEQWAKIVNTLKIVSVVGESPTNNFIQWFKGFVEIGHPINVSAMQWRIIKDHLQLVFVKTTPNYNSVYDTLLNDPIIRSDDNIKRLLEEKMKETHTDFFDPKTVGFCGRNPLIC